MLKKYLKFALRYSLIYLIAILVFGTILFSIATETRSAIYKPERLYSTNKVALSSVQTFNFTESQVLFLYVPRTEFREIQIFISTPDLIGPNLTRQGVYDDYLDFREFTFSSSNDVHLAFIGLYNSGVYYITMVFREPFNNATVDHPTPVQLLYNSNASVVFMSVFTAILSLLTSVFVIIWQIAIIIAIVYGIKALIIFFKEPYPPVSSTGTASSPPSSSTPVNSSHSGSQDSGVSGASGSAGSSSHSVHSVQSSSSSSQWYLLVKSIYYEFLGLSFFEIFLLVAAVFFLFLALLYLEAGYVVPAVILVGVAFLYHVSRMKKREQFISYLKLTKRPTTLKEAAKFLNMKPSDLLSLIIEINKENQVINYNSDTQTIQYIQVSKDSPSTSPLPASSSTPVSPPTTPSHDLPETTHVPEYKCPFCGAIITDPHAQFCSDCGSSLLPAK